MLEERRLQHYGVLGMKWGVRKDEPSVTKNPLKAPYSLTPKKLKDYTSADEYYKDRLKGKYDNFPKSYSNVLNDYWYEGNRYYWDSTKKSYTPKQHKQMLDFFDKVTSYIDENRGVASFDELNKIPQTSNSMSIQADWIKINDLDEDPGAEEKMMAIYNNIGDYTEEEAEKLLAQYALYQLNCSNCVAAYEMRRRGYDVEAMPFTNEITLNRGTDDISKDYKNGLDWVSISMQDSSKTEALTKAAILKNSTGDQRGYVVVDGHIFNYEVQKGNVNWIDGQAPRINDPKVISTFKTTSEVKIARTDNKALSDSILSRIRNRDEE